jgi:hypothetical protein
MMKSTPLHETLAGAVAIAIDDEDQISDALLGKLAFFQVSNDLRITPERLTEYLEYYKIDNSYMPKPIDPNRVLHTVLAAHPKTPGRERSWLIGGRRYKLEFRIEDKQDGSIEGLLVRYRRLDPDTRKRLNLEWETTTVATVVWAPENPEAIGASVVPGYEKEYPYEELLARVEEDFEDQRAHYTGNTLSSIVKKILNDTISLPVRQAGGVWVIPKDAIGTLSQVEKLIDAIAAPPADDGGKPRTDAPEASKTLFYQVDLIDGAKSRLIIRGALETRVMKDLALVIDHLRRLRQAGTPAKPSELATANQLRRNALAIRDYYSRFVNVELIEVSRTLDDLDTLYAEALSGVKTADEEEEDLHPFGMPEAARDFGAPAGRDDSPGMPNDAGPADRHGADEATPGFDAPADDDDFGPPSKSSPPTRKAADLDGFPSLDAPGS